MVARHGAFLSRLARDKRGNTIAIMAAAMVPLIGFSGSAIDMARLYVVKVRLQQACDAGALAGRKAMTDTALNTPLDPAALKQAGDFFKNNFNSGWYKTQNAVFTPIKTADGGTSTVANAVSATATVTVPMSVMGFFGIGARQIAVDCEARYDLADTDVMFVLDTTGSMSCYPTDPTSCATAAASTSSGAWINPEKPQTTYNGNPMYSKIESLRQAVLLFDSTMRANADPTTHFRYGFVPYSSSVNVGYSIKDVSSAYLQTNWTYQSRRLSPNTGTGGVLPGDYAYGAQTNVSFTGIPQNSCVAQRYPATGFSMTGPTGASWGTSYYQAVSYTNPTWTSANSGTCSWKQQPLRALWRYEPIALNTTQYLTGNSTPTPGRLDGLSATWDGCIEELNTSAASSFSVTSLPDDLNPDIKPTDATNLWRPLWPEAEWYRPTYGPTDIKDESVDENRSINGGQYQDYSGRPGMGMDRGGSIACGKKAQVLKTMSAQDVRSYLYDPEFAPHGGTYHDVGMIWGTRMLSAKGIFASTTAAWAGRNEPSRTIVFITDGIMSPSQTSYGLYGLELWENRVGSNGDSGEQKARHNARFLVECAAAKARGITVYTVAVGLNGASAPELDTCSSNGKAYAADDTETLKNVFRTIAQRIAMLRLTQ